MAGVGHLHSTLEVKLSRTHEVVNEARMPYAVVHAYDRFKVLSMAVARRFPYKGVNQRSQDGVFSHT